MANIVIITNLVLLLSALQTLSGRHVAIDPKRPCMQATLYYHDVLFNGTDAGNATSVAAANHTLGSSHFGMMVVFDDPVTSDQLLVSAPVARAQGLYLYDVKEAFNAWFAFTLVFDGSKRKGTLNVMGADLMAEKRRDFSVVGGTGDFFMARGIVTVETMDFQGDFYFRLKMDVKLYECYF